MSSEEQDYNYCLQELQMTQYLINEVPFTKLVCSHLEKSFGKRVVEHPSGKMGVDIGVLKKEVLLEDKKYDPKEIEIFVEVKGTTNKKGKPFENSQNRTHLSVGIFQLMRRLKEPGQEGRLYLPEHHKFESFLTEAALTLKKSGLKIYFYMGEDIGFKQF